MSVVLDVSLGGAAVYSLLVAVVKVRARYTFIGQCPQVFPRWLHEKHGPLVKIIIHGVIQNHRLASMEVMIGARGT